MNKAANFWQAHSDGNGELVWPEDQAEKDALALNFFGLGYVGALDSWLKRADDLLDNPTSADESLRRSPKRALDDKAYRECFSSLSAEQKTVIRKLIRSSVLGALFESLVSVDQVHRGEFEIHLVDRRKDGPEIRARVFPVNEKRTLELHDQLHDWIWNFSQFAQELMTRVPIGPAAFMNQFTV